MVRAAAEGAIGFAGADVLDRKFWVKTALILDHLENEADARVAESRLRINAAAMAQGNFDHYFSRANDLMLRIRGDLQPWLYVDVDPAAIAEQMQAEYTAVFGDPKDPVYAAKIEATIAAWRHEGRDVGYAGLLL